MCHIHAVLNTRDCAFRIRHTAASQLSLSSIRRTLTISSTLLAFPMSVMTAPPLRAFTLALIQLGNIGSNKSKNLQHAREMIVKAAQGKHSAKNPDIIVLPVCILETIYSESCLIDPRNVSIRPMGTLIFQCTQKRSVMCQANRTTCNKVRAKPSRCCHPLQRKSGRG